MSDVMRLNQNQNESINSILLFCGTHCFMIPICDAESEFNYSTNERYHFLSHHKELEQVKNILAWKAAAIKITTKQKKTQSNIDITEKKENQ